MAELKNKKHEMFCLEYLKDLNATRAYIEVYSTSKKESAASNAARVMAYDKVKHRIEELYEERKERVQEEGDGVISFLQTALDFNLLDYLTNEGEIDLALLRKAPVEVQRLVDGTKISTGKDGSLLVNYELISKKFAADKLGSHEGKWQNNHNVKVERYEDVIFNKNKEA